MAEKNVMYDAILSALKSGDMTAREISAATGIPPKKIANRIQGSRYSGTVNRKVFVVGRRVDRFRREPIYSLNRPPVEQTKQARTVNQRYVSEFREIDRETYDIYQGRNLAMLAR